MKKVLCGLVIALMMIGSGYTQENLSYEECSYLKREAQMNIKIAKIYNDAGKIESDRIAKKDEKDLSSIEHTMQNEWTIIRRAHYQGTLWDIFCN